MRKIERVYIGGKLVVPHGTELFPLFNPSEEKVIGQVRLADEEEGRAAIAAAKTGQEPHSRTPKAERIDMLRRLHAEIARRQKAIVQASMEEYGAPTTRAETAAATPRNPSPMPRRFSNPTTSNGKRARRTSS